MQVAVGNVGQVDAHLVVDDAERLGRGQLDLLAAVGDADGDEQRAAQVTEGGGARHGLVQARACAAQAPLGRVGSHGRDGARGQPREHHDGAQGQARGKREDGLVVNEPGDGVPRALGDRDPALGLEDAHDHQGVVGQQGDHDEGRRPHAVIPRAQAVGHPGDEADEQPRQRVPEDREDNLAGVDFNAAREHHDGLVHGGGDGAEQDGRNVEGTNDAHEGIAGNHGLHRRGRPGLVVTVAGQERAHAARTQRDQREEDQRENNRGGEREQADSLTVHSLGGFHVDHRQDQGGDHAQADTGPHRRRPRLLAATAVPGGGHKADNGADGEHRQQQR